MKSVYRFILIFTLILWACEKEPNLPPKTEDLPAEQEPFLEEIVYEVGDYYEQAGVAGIVYKVSEDGKSGMLLSLEEGDCAWAWDMILTGASNKTNGLFNMAAVSDIENWKERYPMFKWCADLGEGWYVPSVDELYDVYLAFNGKMGANNTTMQAFFNNRITSNGGVALSGKAYRSSTETAEYYAMLVDFANGNKFDNYKAYRYGVRAVRSFTVE